MMKEKKQASRILKTLRASRGVLGVYAFFMITFYPMFLLLLNFINQKYSSEKMSVSNNVFENLVQDYRYHWLHPIQTVETIVADSTLKVLFFATYGFLTFLVAMRVGEKWLRLKKHTLEDASEYGSHGTSKWSKEKEILNDSKNFTPDIEKEFGTFVGETVKSKKIIIRKNNSRINGHVFCVAGSGKGKSQCFAIPNIVYNTERSIIASDGKGELFQTCSKLKKKQGYKVFFIDFVKFLGNKWNPLNKMKFDEIDNFSTALVQSVDDKSNSVWGGQAINFISAVIAYVLESLPEKEKHMGSVRKLINLSEKEIKKMFDELPEGSIAKDYFTDVSGSTGKTWDSIKITATNATRFWKQERIKNFTEKSDFNFTDLGKEKIFLAIKIHPTDQTYQPLVNTFFTQMINTLIEDVDEFNGEYPVHIDCDLDEFANMGKIKPLPGALSFIRSLGITIKIIAQDIAQIQKLYGVEETRTIISLCDNFILLGTNEEEVTAKKIVGKLGETTKVIRNDNEKILDMSLANNSQNYNYSGRSLMTVGEITGLDDELGIYIPSGNRRIQFRKRYAYELFPDLEQSNTTWHLNEKPLNLEKESNFLDMKIEEIKELAEKEAEQEKEELKEKRKENQERKIISTILSMVEAGASESEVESELENENDVYLEESGEYGED